MPTDSWIGQVSFDRLSFETHATMPFMATNPTVTVRLRPVIVAYLRDLGAIGKRGQTDISHLRTPHIVARHGSRPLYPVFRQSRQNRFAKNSHSFPARDKTLFLSRSGILRPRKYRLTEPRRRPQRHRTLQFPTAYLNSTVPLSRRPRPPGRDRSPAADVREGKSVI